MYATEDVWDDSDVAQIESLPHEALHRSVDEMIVSADKEGKSTPRVILRHALTLGPCQVTRRRTSSFPAQFMASPQTLLLRPESSMIILSRSLLS